MQPLEVSVLGPRAGCGTVDRGSGGNSTVLRRRAERLALPPWGQARASALPITNGGGPLGSKAAHGSALHICLFIQTLRKHLL